MATGFVIDASVGLKLAIEEAGTSDIRALVSRAEAIVAPELLLSEVANGLWANQRRGVITTDSAIAGLQLISSARIEFVSDADHVARALSLALEIDHPIYDCVYLALALDEDVPLVTEDRRFFANVGKSSYAGRVMNLEAALVALDG